MAESLYSWGQHEQVRAGVEGNGHAVNVARARLRGPDAREEAHRNHPGDGETASSEDGRDRRDEAGAPRGTSTRMQDWKGRRSRERARVNAFAARRRAARVIASNWKGKPMRVALGWLGRNGVVALGLLALLAGISGVAMARY